MFHIFYRGNELDVLIVHSASIWYFDRPKTDAAFSALIDRCERLFSRFSFYLYSEKNQY